MGTTNCMPSGEEVDKKEEEVKSELLNKVKRPEFDGPAALLPLNTGVSATGMKFKELNESIKRCSDESKSFVGRMPLIGICDDINSSYMKGCKYAPHIIRKAFLCSQGSKEHYLGNAEEYVDTKTVLIDCGNLETCNDNEINHKNICELIKNISDIYNTESKSESQAMSMPMPMPMFILGGDHSVTYSVLAGYKESQVDDKIGVIHFDAHPDINTLNEYGKYSHASPFTNLFQSKTIEQVLQIGIRCMESDSAGVLHKYSDRIDQLYMEELFGYGIDYYEQIFENINKWLGKCKKGGISRFYLSVDMDVLEPSVAPGMSHVEPMGLSVKELYIGLDIVMKQLFKDKSNVLIGADIVEYNTLTDYHYVTAFIAARMMRRIVANVIHLSTNQK